MSATPRYNIKPTQDIDIVFQANGAVHAAIARWWFVPHWHKAPVGDWKATTFNARSETAAQKPSFRTAWVSGRCVIPATGYYEWTGAKAPKQPNFLAPSQNIPVFFFAGLYSNLHDGLITAAIVTQEADPQITKIHARMPVILPNDQINDWLAAKDRRYGWAGGFHTYPVKRFGIHSEGPDLIEPFSDPTDGDSLVG